MRLSQQQLFVVTFYNQAADRTDVKGDLYTESADADADADRFTKEDGVLRRYNTMTLGSYIGTRVSEAHNAALRTAFQTQNNDRD